MSAHLLVSAFKQQCLKALKLLYPDGVNTQQQHRDVIRVYMAGWGNALHSLGKTRGELIQAEIKEFLEEAGRIKDPNWWPDNSWAWWV